MNMAGARKTNGCSQSDVSYQSWLSRQVDI